MNRIDRAWLAGLLEGEGCFGYGDSPSIVLGMTDRDVVERARGIMGASSVRGPYLYRQSKKPVYYTSLFGNPAIDLMRNLLPSMGERRSEKIRSIIERRRAAPGRAHRLGKGRKSSCHPERRHYGCGLCRSCWRKDRYSKGLPH